MKKSRTIEKYFHIGAFLLITLFYVILGLILLLGPLETRLARDGDTIGIALIVGITTWIFYCALSFLFFRFIFFVFNCYSEKKNKAYENV